MEYRYYTCDVFTHTQFSGNPLAVFPNAEGITDAQMQQVARELNLSETAFVLPAESGAHDVRVRIFTPGREMPFAGHPTLGTAWVLCHLGMHSLNSETSTLILGENVGPVPVTLRAKHGQLESAELSVAQLPQFSEAPPVQELAEITGLSVEDFDVAAYPPRFASCGAVFLVAVLKSTEALARIRTRPDGFERVLGNQPSQDFWLAAPTENGRWRARMFAPLMGIPEDPATGSAAAAFGGYLADVEARDDGTHDWVIEQGLEMGRPSELRIRVDRTQQASTAVRVRGAAVMVSAGQMFIPPAT